MFALTLAFAWRAKVQELPCCRSTSSALQFRFEGILRPPDAVRHRMIQRGECSLAAMGR